MRSAWLLAAFLVVAQARAAASADNSAGVPAVQPRPEAATTAPSPESSELAKPPNGSPSFGAAEGLTHQESRQLAIDAAFKKSSAALLRLKQLSEKGDREAEYGLGTYYSYLYPDKIKTTTPLLDDFIYNDPKVLQEGEKSEEIKAFLDYVLKQRNTPPEKRTNFGPNDAAEASYRWLLRAAEHGETESQAEIGQAYFDEAYKYIAVVSYLRNLFGKPKPSLYDFPGLQRACKASLMWLHRAIQDADPPSNSLTAKAFFQLGYMYFLSAHGKKTLLDSAGCLPTGEHPEYYILQAAALGNSSAELFLVAKYREQQPDKARYWSQRAIAEAKADEEAGIPEPCIHEAGCHELLFGPMEWEKKAPPGDADKFYMMCQTPVHRYYFVEADVGARTFVLKPIDDSESTGYRVTAVEETPKNLVIAGLTVDGGPLFRAQFRPERQIEFKKGAFEQMDICE